MAIHSICAQCHTLQHKSIQHTWFKALASILEFSVKPSSCCTSLATPGLCRAAMEMARALRDVARMSNCMIPKRHVLLQQFFLDAREDERGRFWLLVLQKALGFSTWTWTPVTSNSRCSAVAMMMSVGIAYNWIVTTSNLWITEHSNDLGQLIRQLTIW